MSNDQLHQKCKVSHGDPINGLETIYLENEWLKIGVLVGRGADIFEVIYKPENTNILLRLDRPIYNPSRDMPQRRDTLNQFEDYYYGGWQSIFPNSAPINYFGAQLGQHGEVWQIPWQLTSISETTGFVAVELTASPLRLPFVIQKNIVLKTGSSYFEVDEKITNKGASTLPYMWGQHIAFGENILKSGGRIEVDAQQVRAEHSMPDNRLITPDMAGQWPLGVDKEGQPIALDQIPPLAHDNWSELMYLTGLNEKASYTLLTNSNLKISVSWPSSTFPYLWYWQERYGMQHYPWWGKVYAIGLEPWTNAWSPQPQDQIDQGLWPLLESGDSRSSKICMEVSTL